MVDRGAEARTSVLAPKAHPVSLLLTVVKLGLQADSSRTGRELLK